MIESINNEKIKKYNKLLQKKYRDETNMYLVSTEHLVLEAQKRNLIIEIFLLENEKNIYGNVTYVKENVMRKLSNLNTIPRVVAVVKKEQSKNIFGNIVMLDGLQDPGNLGTIIRSAVAFNIDTIILGDNTVDLYNEKVLRASEVMIYNINIVKKNLIDSIMELKVKGYKIIGTKVNNGIDIKDIDVDKYAFIIGNEGKGISEDILNICDKYVYIPMNNKCESLNASIASSIIMYEINKKSMK